VIVADAIKMGRDLCHDRNTNRMLRGG
jgi:hypothetical protein